VIHDKLEHPSERMCMLGCNNEGVDRLGLVNGAATPTHFKAAKENLLQCRALRFDYGNANDPGRQGSLRLQPPNGQIWLSSPVSGQRHYDWVLQGGGKLCETQDTKRRRSDGRNCQHIPVRVTRWIAGADSREGKRERRGEGKIEDDAGMDGISCTASGTMAREKLVLDMI
jgi:hypothetical protein